MSLIVKCDNFLLLCVHRDIIIYNPETKAYSVENVPKIPRKVKEANGGENPDNNEANEDENDDEDQKKSDEKQVFGEIDRLAVSPCNRLIAVSTTGDKFLFLYEFQNGLLKLLQSHELNRVSSVLRFSPDSKALLVADKSGDCYFYECSSTPNESNGKWILGHLSIVLDILMTANGKFVISSDRDEKIRVTNYPKTQVVETYCMGHLEFVSAIEEISFDANDSLLVSLSGDKTLRLWNYLDGNELVRVELPAPGLRFARNSKNQFVVVMLDDAVKIAVFEVKKAGNSYDVAKLAEHIFADNINHMNSMSFVNDDCLWVSCHTENDEIALKQLQLQKTNDQFTVVESNPIDVVDILQTNFSTKCSLLEDVSILFKKRFDNITEYQERKKRRIEEKNAK